MITHASISQRGERAVNEDCIGIVQNGDAFLFTVADGLGGHEHGELASRMATEVFKREFESLGHADNKALLDAAFLRAQREIMDARRKAGKGFDMKTTAVALSISDGRCRWGHIGDSRLYMFHKNKIRARTLDHSVPQMLVLSGEIKEKRIRAHPDRNRLLRVMGVEWDAPGHVISDECELAECQAFLLCSDGFWEWIDEKTMCRFLKKSDAADAWLGMMTREVEKNGSGKDMDNYTAIVVLCR
jgi:serine/threonine protein phosphatase PrpC